MRRMLLTLALLVWGLATASGAEVAGQAAEFLAIRQQRGGGLAEGFERLDEAESTTQNATAFPLAPYRPQKSTTEKS